MLTKSLAKFGADTAESEQSKVCRYIAPSPVMSSALLTKLCYWWPQHIISPPGNTETDARFEIRWRDLCSAACVLGVRLLTRLSYVSPTAEEDQRKKKGECTEWHVLHLARLDQWAHTHLARAPAPATRRVAFASAVTRHPHPVGRVVARSQVELLAGSPIVACLACTQAS